MPNNSILVTGANGQLGKQLKAFSVGLPEFDFIFVSREAFPVEDAAIVHRFFETHQPSYCINCAAYTAVDRAETEKDQAYLINATAVGILAKACSLFHCKFIHISTDYVFDGTSAIPLKEDDATNPVNVYGASKLKGEQLAFENNKDTVVIRTSWVYAEEGNNFVRTMIRLMREKESINVINDQVGSPTYAADLANVIIRIINSHNFIPGIYNFSNEGEISWFDFAVAIREISGSKCIINPIPSSQYPTPAKRPHYSLLDKTKISVQYAAVIPDWRKSLEACIAKITRQ